MISAIVYESNTGHTKAYGQILGKELNMPAYELDEAIHTITSSSQIIFLGWLMAGKIMGYKKANKHFDIKCVCAVGMTSSQSQLQQIKVTNKLKDNLPSFILQGGFELDKLTGIYKLMMSTMKNTKGKELLEAKEKTEEEKEMLDLLMNGGNRVSVDKLAPVINWYKKEDI